jgi:hypothetical protein
MRLYLAALFAICFALPVQARDIYVNNLVGDDHYNGLSETHRAGLVGPVATINKALRIVAKGDRIVLANTGQPYRESLSLSAGHQSGLPHLPLVIFGNNAILDGTAPVPPGAWHHVAVDVYRFRPRRLAHPQLYLGPKPAARVVFDPAAGEAPELKPLEWMLRDGHIYFRVEPSKLPRDYELRCAALQPGITLYYVRHVIIRDLVVQGFQLDGVNVFDGASHVALLGLTCRGNGRGGVSIGGSSRATVQSCLIGDNGAAQVRTEGFCLAELIDTTLVPNTAPAIVHEGGRLLIDGQPWQMTE